MLPYFYLVRWKNRTPNCRSKLFGGSNSQNVCIAGWFAEQNHDLTLPMGDSHWLTMMVRNDVWWLISGWWWEIHVHAPQITMNYLYIWVDEWAKLRWIYPDQQSRNLGTEVFTLWSSKVAMDTSTTYRGWPFFDDRMVPNERLATGTNAPLPGQIRHRSLPPLEGCSPLALERGGNPWDAREGDGSPYGCHYLGSLRIMPDTCLKSDRRFFYVSTYWPQLVG